MLPVWGAYFWRGLYIEGLIFGILRYHREESQVLNTLFLEGVPDERKIVACSRLRD